jgi:hypothetical protein
MDTPDEKRPLSASRGNTEGTTQDRICETVASMKGWRPSALGKGPDPGSAFFKRTQVNAGHRIESLSFLDPWDPGSRGAPTGIASK